MASRLAVQQIMNPSIFSHHIEKSLITLPRLIPAPLVTPILPYPSSTPSRTSKQQSHPNPHNIPSPQTPNPRGPQESQSRNTLNPRPEHQNPQHPTSNISPIPPIPPTIPSRPSPSGFPQCNPNPPLPTHTCKAINCKFQRRTLPATE